MDRNFDIEQEDRRFEREDFGERPFRGNYRGRGDGFRGDRGRGIPYGDHEDEEEY